VSFFWRGLFKKIASTAYNRCYYHFRQKLVTTRRIVFDGSNAKNITNFYRISLEQKHFSIGITAFFKSRNQPFSNRSVLNRSSTTVFDDILQLANKYRTCTFLRTLPQTQSLCPNVHSQCTLGRRL